METEVLKKGIGLKVEMRFRKMMNNKALVAIEDNDEERLVKIVDEIEEHIEKLDAELAKLPKRFSKAYDFHDYSKDVGNVIQYYTKWSREDIFGAKKSLARLQKFEKKMDLKPRFKKY